MRSVAIPIALAVLVGPRIGSVGAQEDGGDAAATVTEERQMTLPAGRVYVQAFAEINLSEELVAKPFSIAPDLWYGVSDVLTVGLVHSARGKTGFFGGVGNGLCLAGEENGCAKVYNSVGLDARYHFYREGNLTAAADGGLYLASFDPLQAQLKVGALGRWQGGALALELAPALFAGLTEREPEADENGVVVGTNNKEIFFLPATVLYALTAQLGLAGQVGLVVPFNETGDTYAVALSLGAQYMINEKIAADLAFSLPVIAGGELTNSGTESRSITLGVSYAM